MSEAVQSSITSIPTGASPNSVLGSGYSEGWEKVFKQLAEWARDPEQLEDDGIVAPSRRTCFLAHQHAKSLQLEGHQSPSYVVPSGAGGFIFEWRINTGAARTFELKPDGSYVERQFVANKLQSRRS